MVREPAKTMREAWTAAGLEASLPIVALTYFSLGEGAAELSRVRRVRNRSTEATPRKTRHTTTRLAAVEVPPAVIEVSAAPPRM
jgi:hypothetical protein